MKTIKNTIGILITVLILGTAINANAAVSSVSDKDKLNSLKHMEALGIMSKLSNSAQELNSTVKRDEFAKMISIVDGQQDLATSLMGQTIYSDVKASDNMSGYVNAAVNKGFLTGMADRNFHPKDSVSYAQVVTAAVKALGYGDSDVTGIWPNSYIEKAKILKLLDGITLRATDGIPRWAAATIMDRLLVTNVKKSSSQDSDKTLLDAGGYFSDCVVLGTPKTLASLDNNQVMTDKGIYYMDSDPSKYQVGNKYRVYIDQDASKIEKIYYSFKTIKTYSIKNANSNNISYQENGSIKTMTLPDKVTYYYNGNKLTYSSLITTLHTASSIIFANNDNNVGYDYAVIVDPIYSKPEIAKDVKANDQSIGSIKLTKDEKILKNGDYINLTDIQNNDVVYQVSDINNSNKFIYVIDSKVQGVLTGILPNRLNPSTIQIDSKSYDISKDMNLLKLTDANSEYKIGDTVQVFSGYDGKIVDISKNAEVGTYSDCIILGNSVTLNSLSNNQILTDKGTFYLPDTNLNLQLGAQYRLFISGNKILSAQAAYNKVQAITVNSISDSQIAYSDNGKSNTMTLPNNIDYYYQGTKQTFDNLKNVVQGDTTIDFAYDGNNVGYSYAVIADPIYSKPEIAGEVSANDQKIGSITISKGENIVKNGDYINLQDIMKDDVVYQVSDLNNTNKYIYVYDNKIQGSLTGISPNRLYPKSIQVDSKSYDISKDMNLEKIVSADSDYQVGDTVQLITGYNGKVVDISKNAAIGGYVDSIILANSSTVSSLDDNQILTDKGTYYLSDSSLKLQIGMKYRLYISDNKILSSKAVLNQVKNVVVNNISNSKITYITGGTTGSMTLPDSTVYYYQGVKQTYDNLKNIITGDTTIIFAYNKDNSGYDYAVLVDPIYSKPVIAKNVTVGDKYIGSIDLSEWKTVVRNGDYISPYDITDGEVVYQVSDVGNTNKYILALDGTVSGKLTAILPNRISPQIIQIDGKNYNISKDMDLTSIVDKNSFFKIGDTVQINLGYDSKVVHLDYLDGEDNDSFAYVINTSVGNDNGTPVYYVKLMKTDGTITQYKANLDAIAYKGNLVTFKMIDDSTVSLTLLNYTLQADVTVNKDALKINDSYASSNLKIFNVISNYTGSDANVKVLSISDLYSGIIPANKVIYMNHTGDFNDVNVMVIDDLNDAKESFGVVTGASTVATGKSAATTYTVDINGSSVKWVTQQGYGINVRDVIGLDYSTGQVLDFYKIYTPVQQSTKIDAISTSKIKVSNTTYMLDDNAKIYYRDSSGNMTTLAVANVDLTKTYNNVALYLNKSLDYNGKVEVVVIDGQ